MAETYSPVRLRVADLEIMSSRHFAPNEIYPPIQKASGESSTLPDTNAILTKLGRPIKLVLRGHSLPQRVR
jgi:hypothetical protein